MNKRLFFQIMRFGVVGVTASAVQFFLVVGLVECFSLKPLVANVFAFCISFQVSYFGHRLWTFRGTVVPHRSAFPKLLALQAFNLFLNESLFYIFLCLHLPYQVALLIVLSILPIFTFILSKLFIF